MDALGKCPIPLPLLITGKFCMVCSWLFFIVKNQGIEMLYDSTASQIISGILAAAGILFIVLGFICLGNSVSVGLPREKTEFRSHGIFCLTRNPLYLGGFLICAASCLYSIHPLNFILFAIAFAIHHSIILKEEKFLESAFGRRWIDYKQRVPRYLRLKF
jgi:protein-S-isoprenylcysteine O-methyltransferase Ste14